MARIFSDTSLVGRPPLTAVRITTPLTEIPEDLEYLQTILLFRIPVTSLDFDRTAESHFHLAALCT